jgi:methionyl-tRNA synthetase
MRKRVLVTSALPYANGPIHFGHVVGAYLPADIYVRFRRLLGDDVHFVCGTDEHGVAITLKAEQAGQDYASYVDRWHKEIHQTLTALGVEFDVFGGTAHHRNPGHRALCQQFFTDLLRNGFVFDKTEEQFYSDTLQRFLPDRYVEGGCYVCGFPNARGDECPKCGTWLDSKRLVDPRCTLDGSRPVLKPTRHWYLDLQKIRGQWLQGWFDNKRGQWKGNVEHFVDDALKDLRERPITRDLPWGVPVPLPGTEGKVLYVWFDAPIGYLSISQEYLAQHQERGSFQSWWQSKDTELYHFIGKDNITFHVVVFPSMLWASKRGWVLPSNVPANEFFNLEGQKFNTSRGWYIPEGSAASRVPVDALRYVLTAMMPETADSDWSWKEFQARINGELADNLGNFVARTLRFAERYTDGVIADAGQLAPADAELLQGARAAADEMAGLYGSFQFRRAAQRLMAFSAACNKYYDSEQPWQTRKSDPARCARTIRVCAEAIRSLAILGAPILPGTSRTLLDALGITGPVRWPDAGGTGLPPGPLRPKPMAVLFEKVADEVVTNELNRLKELEQKMSTTPLPSSPGPQPKSPAPATPPGPHGAGAAPAAPAGPLPIDYDQFAAVDLRAATIVSAEKHPKADKLLVVQVDLGNERRTVVAGIAPAYKPEELTGRRVVVVTNLKPRALRGIESNGMILASDDAQGLPRLVALDPAVPNGAKVK